MRGGGAGGGGEGEGEEAHLVQATNQFSQHSQIPLR